MCLLQQNLRPQVSVSHLANYRFNIEYTSGKQNVHADALFRIQWPSVNALLEARHSESAPGGYHVFVPTGGVRQ